jgi:hypothetical protein
MLTKPIKMVILDSNLIGCMEAISAGAHPQFQSEMIEGFSEVTQATGSAIQVNCGTRPGIEPDN